MAMLCRWCTAAEFHAASCTGCADLAAATRHLIMALRVTLGTALACADSSCSSPSSSCCLHQQYSLLCGHA